MERRKRASHRVEARSADLLAWYDRHRRVLPWRAAPGERPDPYRVWLSEIMLQQTTIKAVMPYFARFTARWPNVQALAAAQLDDVLKLWAGLGYYARACHLHACAKVVVERRGCLPQSGSAGHAARHRSYTAAAILPRCLRRPGRRRRQRGAVQRVFSLSRRSCPGPRSRFGGSLRSFSRPRAPAILRKR
jgi:A/G-specific adenine glycosylase